ncbi:helix-turn-helix domain-containing protein [Clostridium beijerinckii]|uniref:helix-turn-helix domain-containing protein n=1 Tax=Clostridium beijerinckii TaxID=1520 RepID=UPI002225B9A8|nr:helix-turn-helix transcriptional regulator [Clostridium beijerinckii]UYZ37234.1 helix-turn-helix domain-containing protein [Clostridium beijerinckii]
MFNKDLIIKAIENVGWSKYKLCKEANLAQSTLSDILSGKNANPRMDTIQKIATALNVSVDTFFDDDVTTSVVESDNLLQDSIIISKKAERDIQKSLSETLDILQNSQDGLMFDGEPLDDLTRELLAQSLENSMRMAKKIAKEKYTPKKYKK